MMVKTLNNRLLLTGILCVNANAASPVLINSNFDAFNISTAPYTSAYNATTNPNGYNQTFGNSLGAYAGSFRTTTTGIGWQTDQAGANDVIEIWSSGFNSISSAGGSGQFAELNANSAGSLFQDVTIATVGDVDYGFAHVNRSLGTDTLKVLITYLGLNGVIGGGDDTVVVDRNFSTTNATIPRVWSDFAVDNAFVSVAGGAYRFSFSAISTATPGGDTTQGNFLDNVRFGINSVPEPSSALLGAFGGLALLRRRRH
jgi:hypothetical protein